MVVVVVVVVVVLVVLVVEAVVDELSNDGKVGSKYFTFWSTTSDNMYMKMLNTGITKV